MATQSRLFTPAFLLTCFTSFTFAVGIHLTFAALPLYVVALGGSESEVGLVIGAISITAVVATPLLGGAIDRWGPRPILLLAAALSLLASTSYLLATSIVALLAIRLAHGLGLSGFHSPFYVLVANMAPDHRRGEALGFYGLSSNLSMAISPAIGLLVANQFGFPALFVLSAAIMLVALVAITLLPATKRPVDTPAWSLRTILSPEAIPAAILSFSMFATYGTVLSFVSVWAWQNGVDNPGLFFTVYAIALIMTRPIAGVLSDRYGRATVIVPALMILGAAIGSLSIAKSMSTLALAALAYGIGFGSTAPTLAATIADKVRSQSRGAGMSTLLTGSEAGIICGSVAMGFVLQSAGFTAMFLLAGAVPILSSLAFASTLLRRSGPDKLGGTFR
ncbi:MAG: MFS transporter [Chloroflexi bacterium]|nr:MFS transporter [Chloroflexota bacterium]